MTEQLNFQQKNFLKGTRKDRFLSKVNHVGTRKQKC